MAGPDGADIAPTGKTFEVDFCTVAHWVDGKIVEEIGEEGPEEEVSGPAREAHAGERRAWLAAVVAVACLFGTYGFVRSPVPGVKMADFMKLARMYKGDYKSAALRRAVKALLERPAEEINQEVKTFGVIETLAGIGCEKA